MSGNHLIFTHRAHIISSRLKTQAVRAASLFVITAFLYTCRQPVTTTRVIEVERAMGTYFEITIYHPDEEAARAGARAAFAEISRIERLTSNYRPDSELTELNRSAARQPYAASDELFEIIREALVYSRMSDGAFDVTVGPLLKLWGVPKKARLCRQTANSTAPSIRSALKSSCWMRLESRSDLPGPEWRSTSAA